MTGSKPYGGLGSEKEVNISWLIILQQSKCLFWNLSIRMWGWVLSIMY